MTKLYTLPTGEAHTAREWAAISGIRYAILSLRLRQGMPIERAIMAQPRAHRVTHDGKCLTYREWEEVTGMPAPLIYSRILNGWSAERALTEARNNWTPAGLTQP